ncbi:MAG: type II toxin-antitoxin system RelE/ParE family toxin [Nitrospiraceae bacterium]
MAGKRPVFTQNFSDNLTAIQSFLGVDGRAAFQRLLDRLFEETIPTLCRFPQSGRSFLNRVIKSSKAEALTKDLRRLLKKDDDLREYLMDDHLVLYVVRYDRIVFLAIKHHRQLSFDLKHFWLED